MMPIVNKVIIKMPLSINHIMANLPQGFCSAL